MKGGGGLEEKKRRKHRGSERRKRKKENEDRICLFCFIHVEGGEKEKMEASEREGEEARIALLLRIAQPGRHGRREGGEGFREACSSSFVEGGREKNAKRGKTTDLRNAPLERKGRKKERGGSTYLLYRRGKSKDLKKKGPRRLHLKSSKPN